MAKLAEVGDIISDKTKRSGTVITSTKTSITVKYEHSTEKSSFNPTVFELQQIGLRLLASHTTVLFIIKIGSE